MERINFGYSTKNIKIPKQKGYLKRLIHAAEKLTRRMRWKAYFYLNPDKSSNIKETYGFKSHKSPPVVTELQEFENNMFELVRSVKFKPTRKDQFRQQLSSDSEQIMKSENLLVPADKTTNYYKVGSDKYNQLLAKHVQKDYKRTTRQENVNINKEAKKLAEGLDLDTRINTTIEKTAYITIKDHKDNFQNNTQCRLINPAKPELGKVSKSILDSINSKLRITTNVNQWKNSYDVINWFKDTRHKSQSTFVNFDIVNFYPTITQQLLSDAISFAQQYIQIDQQDITIIQHARQSLLYTTEGPWRKRSCDTLFDVTMGSYDGAEVCELVGIYLLNKIQDKTTCNIGLYRDDGLIIIRDTPREVEKLKKCLCTIFKTLGLQITIEANKKIINFLDITFNLNTEAYRPYTKPGNTPLYIHKSSNHPPAIIKNIPLAINKRLSCISSDEANFNSEIGPYQQALKDSGYSYKLKYTKDNTTPKLNRKRSRKITWFNPPYNKAVTTNIGQRFLKIINRIFVPSHALYKIFNKNNLKVSYSCMPNIAAAMSTHNKQLLKTSHQASTHTSEPVSDNKTCNCRNSINCPLNGNCLQKTVIYQATVNSINSKETYVGLTEQDFKTRYRNHATSFNNAKYKNSSELSKHIWFLKSNNTDYEIKWDILARSSGYNPSTKTCMLCLTEKYFIIYKPELCTLNKRDGIISSCRHINKHLLINYKGKLKD